MQVVRGSLVGCAWTYVGGLWVGGLCVTCHTSFYMLVGSIWLLTFFIISNSPEFSQKSG